MNQPYLDLSGYHSPINLAAALNARDEGIDFVMNNSSEWKDEAMAEPRRWSGISRKSFAYINMQHNQWCITMNNLSDAIVAFAIFVLCNPIAWVGMIFMGFMFHSCSGHCPS